MNDIIINNLSKSFGDKKVFDDYSVTIKSGKTTCIMGASGTGKTTLIRIIAGLIKKDGGTIQNVPEKISVVFQEDRLCEDFSVLSNIKFILSKDFDEKKITSHLRELGLNEYSNRPVRELSGGMKRRVAILRAICYGADLILLDEPFKGLDDDLKSTVVNYVKNNTKNKTVICITHDIREAKMLDSEIIEL